MSRHSQLFAFAIVISVVSFVVGMPAAKAAADNTDLPVAIDISDLSDFQDVEGNSISIDNDTTTDNQRLVTGEEQDGSAVEITIYLGTSESINDDTLTGDVQDGVPAQDNSPSEVDPDTLTAQVVVAATPTTIAVAWMAPAGTNEYTLGLNGEQTDTSSSPSFTVTDLPPAQNFTLSLGSTSDSGASGSDPAGPTPNVDCPSPGYLYTHNLATWDTSATAAHGHNTLLVGGGLHVSTDDSSATALATGAWPDLIALSDAKTPTITETGSGSIPLLALSVDFDGDGTADGSLSKIGSDEYVTSNAAGFVEDAAPSDSEDGGSLAEWQSAFPDAMILTVGWALGPSIQGAGTIHSFTVGCDTFEFGAPTSGISGVNDDTTMSLTVSTLTPSSGSRSSARRSMSGVSTEDAGALIPYINTSTEFNYRTFLPYSDLSVDPVSSDRLIVKACIAGAYAESVAGGHPYEHPNRLTFIGDGRTFQQPTIGQEDFRTMMDVTEDWTGNTNPVLSNDVGTTEIVDPTDDDSVVDSRRASTSGMTLSGVTKSSNFVGFDLNHVANDPFCPSVNAVGAITYAVHVSMYRSGLVVVQGKRATMPAHEGWVRWNGGDTWTNMFRLDGTALVCLIAGNIGSLPGDITGCSGPVSGSANEPAPAVNAVSATSAVADSGDYPLINYIWMGPGVDPTYGIQPGERVSRFTVEIDGIDSTVQPFKSGLPYYNSVGYDPESDGASGGSITEVRGWLNGRQVSLGQGSWSSQVWANRLVISTPEFIIDGAKREAETHAFMDHGILSWELNGTLNVVTMSNLGDPYASEGLSKGDYDALQFPSVASATLRDTSAVADTDGDFGVTFSATRMFYCDSSCGPDASQLQSVPSLDGLSGGTDPDGPFPVHSFTVGTADMSLTLPGGAVLPAMPVAGSPPPLIVTTLDYVSDQVSSYAITTSVPFLVPGLVAATMSPDPNAVWDLLNGAVLNFTIGGAVNHIELDNAFETADDSWSGNEPTYPNRDIDELDNLYSMPVSHP
ncbi:MAG TPA: hypothetical protein VGM84_16345 [Steroidobacteraceae bacterium]